MENTNVLWHKLNKSFKQTTAGVLGSTLMNSECQALKRHQLPGVVWLFWTNVCRKVSREYFSVRITCDSGLPEGPGRTCVSQLFYGFALLVVKNQLACEKL